MHIPLRPCLLENFQLVELREDVGTSEETADGQELGEEAALELEPLVLVDRLVPLAQVAPASDAPALEVLLLDARRVKKPLRRHAPLARVVPLLLRRLVVELSELLTAQEKPEFKVCT